MDGGITQSLILKFKGGKKICQKLNLPRVLLLLVFPLLSHIFHVFSLIPYINKGSKFFHWSCYEGGN